MSGIFSITATSSAVRLDAYRGGTLVFSVTNRAGCALRARFTPRPRDGRSTSWLSVDGQSERQLEDAAVEHVTVRIAVPEQAAAGVYAFRLEVVGVANPDELVTEGPWVEITVAAAVAPGRGFPWWVLPLGAGALALAGSIVLLVQDDHVAALIIACTAVLLVIGGIVLLVHARGHRALPASPVSAPAPPIRVPAVAAIPRGEQSPAPGRVAALTSTASSMLDASGPLPQPRLPELTMAPDVATVMATTVSTVLVTEVATAVSAIPPSAAIRTPTSRTDEQNPHRIMPRLVGWTQADASTALAALGVSAGTVTTAVSSAAPGTVLDQRPSDGQPITPGHTVDLVVACLPSADAQVPSQPAVPASSGAVT